MPESIDLFYTYVCPMRRKRRRKIKQKSKICELMTKVMRGYLNANDAINDIIRDEGYPIRELYGEEGKSLIQNIAVELFAESCPTGKETNGKPLGLLAEQLVLKYSSLDRFENDEDLLRYAKEIHVLENALNNEETTFAEVHDQIKRFDCSSLILSIPILNVYGQVELTYMKTLRKIQLIDTVSGGD